MAFIRFVSFMVPVAISPLAEIDPPLPPEAGRFLQIVGQKGIQKKTQTIDFQDDTTQRVIWKNVSASMKTHYEQDEALTELAALTSQAAQYDLLAMAYMFEERFHRHIDLTYMKPEKVFRHLVPLLEPENVHRLAKRVQGRFRHRFSRRFKQHHQIRMATKILEVLLPSLQEKPRRQAVSKLIDLFSWRYGYLKDAAVDILLRNADMAAPEEFRAAAYKITEAILKSKMPPKEFDWSSREAALALGRLMRGFIPLLEDKIGSIVAIENQWRQGDYRLQEVLEVAIAALTVQDRLTLLERLMAPNGLKGLYSPTVSLILNEVPVSAFGDFVKRQDNPELKKLFDRYQEEHGRTGPFR